ncbi:glycoside hydrolase family 2 protein [Aestuariimicrobium ganziense]|uniref:glycoside hydrolase family 2 protein n=1 Tax=Aestuariimicrobium ganziense TaxID=2773677 RepID=UPI001944F8D9|nr:glycoside hydrolase family 2 TIM barrel-domain containing protein [Aestuariimicrobium ganziense]
MPVGLTTVWGENLDPDAVLPEYPRPMLERDEWLSLNGPWDHAVRPDTGTTTPPERWDEPLLVPFAIETAASGVQRALRPDEVLYVSRQIVVPPVWRGRRVVLHAEAVDHDCTVLVNGVEVGRHRGGYLPFSVELPRGDADVVDVCLAVRDPSDAGLQQRGKQSLHPDSIWYTATSGPWQSIWLEPLPEAAITRVVATTDDLRSLEVLVEAERPGTVRVAVDLPDGPLVVDGRTDQPISIPLADPHPWTPDDPHLYRLTVTTEHDRVTTWAGLRTIAIGPIPGAVDGQRHAILLNGRPILLNTPLWQGYWPESGMTAPADAALVHDLETMKAMGFNGVRVHVKVESRRFYHHADRLGLLVVQDAVSGGRPMTGLTASGVVQALDLTMDDRSALAMRLAGRTDAATRQEFTDELCAMVTHLAPHPSIVMWVPFNESWGQFDARGAARLVRRLDPTRLVDHASGWFDQGDPEFRSRHRYVLKLRRPPRRDRRPFSLSEFGGLNLAVPGHLWDEQRRFGYRFFDDADGLAEAFTRLYREQLVPLVAHGLRAATYTQVSDVEIETNGLLTYDRAVTKLPVDLVARLNRELDDALAALGRR